jgi:hypothetical protein
MLLETRRLILTKAGFQVRTVTEQMRAATALFDEEINLFILCHTLSSQQRKDSLLLAHELQPTMKNLVLTDDLPKKILESQDSVVDCFLGPEALLSIAIQLTQSKSLISGLSRIDPITY